MAINKATLAKEVDGVIEYIYPKTTSDIVEYTPDQTVEQKLDEVDTDLTNLSDNLSDNYYDKTDINDFLYELVKVSVTVDPAICEVGSVNPIKVSWVADLKAPNTLTALTVEGSPQSVASNTGYTIIQGISSTKTFNVIATDSKASNSGSDKVTFTNKLYWGVGSVMDTYNSAFILALDNSELSEAKAKSFTVNASADKYIYFALPVSYGTPVFTVGGFEGGFEQVATISFVNASGYSTNYAIYRSKNHSLGVTTVNVR